MPRVTEAHRKARRDEIAEAALRALRRNGVSNTSIAQIVEECGLSAGAIYANFENKAELARYIAQALFDWRLHRIAGLGGPGVVLRPVDVLRAMLELVTDRDPPTDVLLQFWGEATRDDDLRRMLETKMGAMRDAFASAVLPWAQQRDSTDAEALAQRTAAAMVMVCQGHIAHRELLGWISAEEFLAAAEQLFAD